MAKKFGGSRSEWTPTNGLIVSGDVIVDESPTYIYLAPDETSIRHTIEAGRTLDNRRVLLDMDADNHILGVEIV